MSKRSIIIEPDPILRKKSDLIEKVDDELRKLMDDMLQTMYAAPGIGLAAVQIGILKRLIVIDISKEEKKNPIFLVNPVIISRSENKSVYEEGCLSLPGQFAEIERPAECIVKYLDYQGKQKELKADGLLATCIQHEIDHLNGVLFIDYLSKLKKDMIIKRLKKKKKRNKYKYPLNFMSLKLIFMGTPQFAVPILKSINDSNHHVLCVYTQPPQKKTEALRKKLLQFMSILTRKI